MQEGKGRMDEAAERLGVAVGKVLKKGLDLVSGFGEGLKEGMKAEEEETPVTAQEILDRKRNSRPSREP